MGTIELTNDNFEKTIEDNDIVLIDFWAEWCGPCKMFGPVFEKVSENHADVTFAKCDTEVQRELAAKFDIRSIPMLMVFREGIPIFGQPGALPEDVLEELVGRIKELDMDEVRQKIKEAEEAEGE